MNNIIENGTKVRIFSDNGYLDEHAIVVSSKSNDNFTIYTLDFDDTTVFDKIQCIVIEHDLDISKPMNIFGMNAKMEVIKD